jgi:glycosyltransferase involved in cell wall biosynthesis
MPASTTCSSLFQKSSAFLIKTDSGLKFFFVHQNFPGQYLHIVRSLLADNEKHPGTHEIVFMTEPNANTLNGVRKVTYARPPQRLDMAHRDAREFESAMRRAENCATGARQIKKLGFTPDIIIGHHGWGELLNLTDVFPGVPILGYFEFYYKITGADVNFDPEFVMPVEQFSAVRAKNGINHLALTLDQHGQVPTRWQRGTYPDWAHRQLNLLEEGVDLATCEPDSALRRRVLQGPGFTVAPGQKLITYVARNLEPYRGFHTVMRALPAILNARPDVVVSMVGGDEISYGTAHPQGPWREILLKELDGQLDLSRVHFPGKIPYAQHLALLKRSDAHIYFSYPFVASWSLREALACGCLIIGSDTETVTEFVTDGETGLIAPALDSSALAQTVLTALEDGRKTAKLRKAARAYAEQHLDLNDYLRRYRDLIERVSGKSLAPAKAPAATRRKTAKG